jgi:hypothetical protein
VIYFANSTTGQYFTITLEPPPGAAFSGTAAEWIMEATGEQTRDGKLTISSLPKFTPVQFTTAICAGLNTVGDPATGDTWNITRSGQALTSVTTAHDTVTIDYIGP